MLKGVTFLLAAACLVLTASGQVTSNTELADSEDSSSGRVNSNTELADREDSSSGKVTSKTELADSEDSSSGQVTNSNIAGRNCSSYECITDTKRLHSWMNSKARPCQDFYEFACGNFGNSTADLAVAGEQVFAAVIEKRPNNALELAEDALANRIVQVLSGTRHVNDSDPQVNQLFDFARAFYSSCSQWMLNRDELNKDDEKNRSLLLKTWSDFMRTTLKERKSLALTTEYLLAVLIKSGNRGLLDVKLSNDELRSTLTKSDSMNLHQKKGALPSTKKRLHETLVANISLNMADLPSNMDEMTKMLQFLVRSGLQKKILQFEANLTKSAISIHKSVRDSWDSTLDCSDLESSIDPQSFKSNERLTLRQLNALSRCVNPSNPFSWNKLVEQIVGQNVGRNITFNLYQPARVISFLSYIKSREATEEYVNLKIIIYFDWLMKFFLELRALGRSANGSESSQPEAHQTASCLYLARQYLKPILPRMYHSAFVPPNVTAGIKEIFETVRKVAKQKILSHDWTAEFDDMNTSLARVEAYELYIGFHDESVPQLMEVYKPLLRDFRRMGEFSNSSLMFGQMMSLAMRYAWRHHFLGLFAMKRSVSVFDVEDPLSIMISSAYKKPDCSRGLVVPTGVLTPPLYHPSFPDIFNLANVALGFATWYNGVLRDEECVPVEHRNKTGKILCLMEQYNNMSNNTFSATIGWYDTAVQESPEQAAAIRFGFDTLGLMFASEIVEQSISDSSGSIAGSGGQSAAGQLTPKQAFFVQAAQNWCTRSTKSGNSEADEFRRQVNGAVSNDNNFVRSFNCAAGSPMNREEKCPAW